MIARRGGGENLAARLAVPFLQRPDPPWRGPAGSPHLQPAITRRGSELVVCANQTTASGDVGDLRYYLRSEGFATAHVLDGSATVKAYPTSPETTTATIPIARTGAFRGTVQLSVTGLPPSMNAVLTPASVSLDDDHPEATVTLELDTRNTAPGAYDALVTAGANGVERALAIPLTVHEDAPAADAPADLADLADVTEGPPADGAP